MPLNVRRFCTSGLLVLAGFILITQAQTVAQSPPQTSPQTPPQTAPTSGDIMRGRISKAKAFIAVRNYNAAIYELENIRKESADASVQGVVNVLLMNSYLEQGDYKRAQELLTGFYAQQKAAKPNASAAYMAVAGQIIKGARNRVERYRALGLTVSDRTLPLEALNDLEKMRETLELVITQSKEMGKTPASTSDAMMLLEEASNSRSMLARDDYDARHWKDEIADTREQMASSHSVVLSAINDTSTVGSTVGGGTKPAEQSLPQPMQGTTANPTRDREVKLPDSSVAQNDKPVYMPAAMPVTKEVKQEPKREPGPLTDTPKTDVPKSAAPTPDISRAEAQKDNSPLDVGSLIAYATRQTTPVYPPAAKSIRTTGIVKVEVTVDEKGDVSEVQKTSGPPMLQAAAKDAIKKWKFKPFVRDGQPVKATGFVSFNFAL